MPQIMWFVWSIRLMNPEGYPIPHTAFRLVLFHRPACKMSGRCSWPMLAPNSSRSRTMSRWPLRDAKLSAVMPRLLTKSLSAPDSSSRSTTCRWPSFDAHIRAVSPYLSAKSLPAPDFISSRTTSKWPISDAMKRAVAPSLLAKLLLALDSSSRRTIPDGHFEMLS